MRMHPLSAGLAALCATFVLAAACADDDTPTGASAGQVHQHADPLLALNAPVQVKQKIAQLRRWSATFHDLNKAAAAGYSANIGCIDETVNGVDPSVARGMGYHVTRGDVDLVGDGEVDIDQPEFLVYAPHPNDARLPKEERLRKARLVGFDYYVPGADWPHPEPPEFFGEPFNWSPAFQGWIRHIYLWGHNPDGTFSDFNPAVRICTELLNP